MERLILSGDLKAFPVRTDSSSHVHPKDRRGNDEDTELIGLDGHERKALSSTNEEVTGLFLHPSRRNGAESKMSTMPKARPWPSPALGSTSESTASFSSVYSDFAREA